MNVKSALTLLLLFQCGNCATGANWALLVAGSKYYSNYRHQADIYRAYKLLNQHGIPRSNIIVMHYDDIAYHERNPFPGKVFNTPIGINYYNDIPKDYTGKTVTAENFLNVLMGNSTAMEGIGSGRVIRSTQFDNIFVNFVDHGGEGVLAFPHDMLTIKMLNNSLETMYRRKKYNNMLLYIEACYAGSMFEGTLSKNANIYAMTAANSHQSSYACCRDDLIGAYLGDEFSVQWMDAITFEDLNNITVSEQFAVVKEQVFESEVSRYGDLTVGHLKMSEFFGANSPEKKNAFDTSKRSRVRLDAVPSSEVPMLQIKQQWYTKSLSKKTEAAKQMEILSTKRRSQDVFFDKLAKLFNLNIKDSMQVRVEYARHMDCQDQLAHTFEKYCYKFGQSPYSTKYAVVLFHICQQQLAVEEATERIARFCTTEKFKDFSE